MKAKRWIILLIVVIGIGAAIFATRSSSGGPIEAAPSTAAWIESGFIEAETIAVLPEIAGRVVALPVNEGDEVSAGEVLIQLADDMLSAQVDLARGKLEEAQAVLAKAQAGSRRESIGVAEAQIVLAQAARAVAKQAWVDAQLMRDHPQSLDVQIAAARAQVTVAQKEFEAALLQRDIAEQAWKDYGETSDKLAGVPMEYRPSLPAEYYAIPYQWEQAVAAVNVEQTNRDAAQTALNNLLNQRSNPQTQQTQVDAADSEYQTAEAQVAVAQAVLSGVKAGATTEQIAAAKAQVDVAQAALESAQLQLNKATVTAPQNSLVMASSLHVGEMAAPNIAAMTLANLDEVTLTIYVPGADLGRVAIGQTIEVRVDAFTDRTFGGAIVRISDQAEYTPRNVRTSDERTKLVYAVKIKIANPDHALKPGLQAEAQLGQ
ncbi:MAG TPA: efflux RND transporter periplasmic adaptor subunit [Anaerolineae bacterium]|nr:efflux RND transporter periplasmic adaptor subunit [Anaerolineae bacterium]